MVEDGRAVALDMLVEPDAGAGLGHDRREVVLRTSSGSRRRSSSPFRSIRSKAVGAVVTDEIKRRNAVFIAGHSFAIDDARARA
jgi:hypothetical protein